MSACQNVFYLPKETCIFAAGYINRMVYIYVGNNNRVYG